MANLAAIDGEAIARAVAEFDRLGREVFLARYGYRKASRFMLKVGRRLYDSKAIIGCAAQWSGLGRPLRASEFSGGASRLAGVYARAGLNFLDTTKDKKG